MSTRFLFRAVSEDLWVDDSDRARELLGHIGTGPPCWKWLNLTIATLTYQQSIQGAFRDVSNALIAYRKYQEFRAQQEHPLESVQDAARLSEGRFKSGTTDYLEVLTNEPTPSPPN